jgi:hypothetical protein
MKNMNYNSKLIAIVVLLLITIFTSCSKDDANNNTQSKPAENVYVAGTEYNIPTGKYIAKYWKNGKAVNLTDGTKESFPVDIKVVNNDVYVLGYEAPDNVYWKNGVKTILTPISNPENELLEKMFIDNNNIYFFGRLKNKYVYLKNNDPAVELFTEQLPSQVIYFVENGNVYVVVTGKINNIVGTRLYKNNSLVRDYVEPNRINSIYVKNDIVYACGYTSLPNNVYKSTYWKDGVATALPAENRNSIAAKIFVSDANDVYVSGEVMQSGNNLPYRCYWKNSDIFIKSELYIKEMFSYNNNFYGASNKSDELKGIDIAQYQKNNEFITLGEGKSQSRVEAIYVTKNND